MKQVLKMVHFCRQVSLGFAAQSTPAAQPCQLDKRGRFTRGWRARTGSRLYEKPLPKLQI